MLVVNDRLAVPLKEFRFTFSRSGGPGGQNVNKVNSKVTLHWPAAQSPSLPEEVRTRLLEQSARRINADGELVVVSQRFRDQGRNVADCLAKLREMIAAAARRPTPRKPTKPSRGAKERRLQEKRIQSQAKRRRQSKRFDD
jgi:ribosome-associated protein